MRPREGNEGALPTSGACASSLSGAVRHAQVRDVRGLEVALAKQRQVIGTGRRPRKRRDGRGWSVTGRLGLKRGGKADLWRVALLWHSLSSAVYIGRTPAHGTRIALSTC